MKVLLILSTACLFAPALAGVRELSPQEEQEALQLFAQICGQGSEGSRLGDTLVYCKRARGDLQETLNHQVQVDGNAPGQSQVVFVQPPPVKYLHRVAITGQGAQGQQAKIYVLPQKATHELQAQYQGGATQAQKPVVYFLKGNPNGGNNGGNNNGGNNGGYPDNSGSNGGGYQRQQAAPAPGVVNFVQPVRSSGYN